jgi:serine/threonine protein kinase
MGHRQAIRWARKKYNVNEAGSPVSTTGTGASKISLRIGRRAYPKRGQAPGAGSSMSADRIGKFQVLGSLGTGAHSTILHIRRSADSKQFALKVVPVRDSGDLKFLEQAQHEFRVAQMLDHPSLIKVYALETARDWLFRVRKIHLLIEYVNGRTLDTFKRLPIPQLVLIFARVADAMVQMHRRHVCHADLKPNNIMLSRAGEVKIIDYGLAWIKGEDKHRLQGTPEYMAPEQAKKSIVNEHTDIYNFGATMYRLTTFRLPPSVLAGQGSLPPDARNWSRVLKPVQECNAEVPEGLCDLIHRCLAFYPNQRPERMFEVKEVLDGLAEALASSSEHISLEGIE